MADWQITRLLGFGSILLCGLTADWEWYGCAMAWLFVAIGLLVWSISENEARNG